MESSAKPNNYIFIPAEVKNCKELKPNEKIIFGEITSLCNKKGYCWAGNHYFAELYGVSKRSVSRYINRLKSLNFITINMIRDANKNVISRIIKINDNPIEKTDYTSGQNCLAPIDRTVQYNNTVNNTSIKEKIELFEIFWRIYDKNISKKTAKEKFIKLAIEDCKKCVEVVSNYVKSTPNKTFRKHVSTLLNQECWNDEIVVVEECGVNNKGIQSGTYKGMII